MTNTNNLHHVSSSQWRMIGIALSILSLGLAIAWAGFIWYGSQQDSETRTIPTPSTMKN